MITPISECVTNAHQYISLSNCLTWIENNYKKYKMLLQISWFDFFRWYIYDDCKHKWTVLTMWQLKGYNLVTKCSTMMIWEYSKPLILLYQTFIRQTRINV